MSSTLDSFQLHVRQEETLLYIIKRRGDCSIISCAFCPFKQHRTTPGDQDVCYDFLQDSIRPENRNAMIYKKCIIKYVELYGKENLIEELI